jgi:hypothetical protein
MATGPIGRRFCSAPPRSEAPSFSAASPPREAAASRAWRSRRAGSKRAPRHEIARKEKTPSDKSNETWKGADVKGTISIFLLMVAELAVPAAAAEQQWLPKNGPYAPPGGNHDERCLDFGDFVLDLSRQFVGDSDGACEVLSVAHTGPSKIRLEMSCSDTAHEAPHKEIALVQRLDDDKITYRETEEGKWKRPPSIELFCSGAALKLYEDGQKHPK